MRDLPRQGKRNVNAGAEADPALHVRIDLVRERATVTPTNEGETPCQTTR